jgi:hypothetical protein
MKNKIYGMSKNLFHITLEGFSFYANKDGLIFCDKNLNGVCSETPFRRNFALSEIGKLQNANTQNAFCRMHDIFNMLKNASEKATLIPSFQNVKGNYSTPEEYEAVKERQRTANLKRGLAIWHDAPIQIADLKKSYSDVLHLL